MEADNPRLGRAKMAGSQEVMGWKRDRERESYLCANSLKTCNEL